LKEISLTTKNTFEEYLEGYKLAGGSQQRTVTIALVVLGGYLIYDGLTSEPISVLFSAVGGVFILYSLIVRNIILKKKLQRKWANSENDNSQQITFTLKPDGLNLSTQKDGDKAIEWSNFKSYSSNSKVICLYFANEPNRWLTIPLFDANQETKKSINEYLQEKITNSNRH
jgi:hypothetical protein